MSTTNQHLPVLVDEVISYLNPQNKKIYFDGTFGHGGYSKKILKFKTKVIALDRDFSSEKYATELKKNIQKTFFLKSKSFLIFRKL